MPTLVLPLLLRWRAGTRDFFPALAALVGPVQNIFTSSYIISLHLSPSLCKLGRQSCHVACLWLYRTQRHRDRRPSTTLQDIGVMGTKNMKVFGEEIIFCTGLASAAKAGQNSIVPAWGALPRKNPFHMYSKSPHFQQSAGRGHPSLLLSGCTVYSLVQILHFLLICFANIKI